MLDPEEKQGYDIGKRRVLVEAERTDDPIEVQEVLRNIIERTPDPMSARDRGRLRALNEALDTVSKEGTGDTQEPMGNAPDAPVDQTSFDPNKDRVVGPAGTGDANEMGRPSDGVPGGVGYIGRSAKLSVLIDGYDVGLKMWEEFEEDTGIEPSEFYWEPQIRDRIYSPGDKFVILADGQIIAWQPKDESGREYWPDGFPAHGHVTRALDEQGTDTNDMIWGVYGEGAGWNGETDEMVTIYADNDYPTDIQLQNIENNFPGKEIYWDGYIPLEEILAEGPPEYDPDTLPPDWKRAKVAQPYDQQSFWDEGQDLYGQPQQSNPYDYNPWEPDQYTPPDQDRTWHPDLSAYTYQYGLGGSTGAKLVSDPDGTNYVLKRGADPGHLMEESYADDMYRSLGVPVPASNVYRDVHGNPAKVSEFLEGTSLRELMDTGDPAAQEAIANLRNHFVVDALAGNWDVIGLDFDNVLHTKDGQTYRIDNGGSLRRRAMGAPKPSGAWSCEVSEIYTLRDPGMNYSAASVYGDITDEEIVQQINYYIIPYRDRLIASVPPDLQETIACRIDWLEQWAGYDPYQVTGGIHNGVVQPDVTEEPQDYGIVAIDPGGQIYYAEGEGGVIGDTAFIIQLRWMDMPLEQVPENQRFALELWAKMRGDIKVEDYDELYEQEEENYDLLIDAQEQAYSGLLSMGYLVGAVYDNSLRLRGGTGEPNVAVLDRLENLIIYLMRAMHYDLENLDVEIYDQTFSDIYELEDWIKGNQDWSASGFGVSQDAPENNESLYKWMWRDGVGFLSWGIQGPGIWGAEGKPHHGDVAQIIEQMVDDPETYEYDSTFEWATANEGYGDYDATGDYGIRYYDIRESPEDYKQEGLIWADSFLTDLDQTNFISDALNYFPYVSEIYMDGNQIYSAPEITGAMDVAVETEVIPWDQGEIHRKDLPPINPRGLFDLKKYVGLEGTHINWDEFRETSTAPYQELTSLLEVLTEIGVMRDLDHNDIGGMFEVDSEALENALKPQEEENRGETPQESSEDVRRHPRRSESSVYYDDEFTVNTMDFEDGLADWYGPDAGYLKFVMTPWGDIHTFHDQEPMYGEVMENGVHHGQVMFAVNHEGMEKEDVPQEELKDWYDLGIGIQASYVDNGWGAGYYDGEKFFFMSQGNPEQIDSLVGMIESAAAGGAQEFQIQFGGEESETSTSAEEAIAKLTEPRTSEGMWWKNAEYQIGDMILAPASMSLGVPHNSPAVIVDPGKYEAVLDDDEYVISYGTNRKGESMNAIVSEEELTPGEGELIDRRGLPVPGSTVIKEESEYIPNIHYEPLDLSEDQVMMLTPEHDYFGHREELSHTDLSDYYVEDAEEEGFEPLDDVLYGEWEAEDGVLHLQDSFDTPPELIDRAYNYFQDSSVMGKLMKYAEGDHSKDGMICLVPPEDIQELLAVEDGEDPDDLHVTLVYLPEETLDKMDKEELKDLCDEIIKQYGAMVGRIAGLGTFVNKEDKDVLWASVDIPSIDDLRSELATKIEGEGHLDNCDGEHGFTPHMTLHYTDDHYKEIPTMPDGLDEDFIWQPYLVYRDEWISLNED